MCSYTNERSSIGNDNNPGNIRLSTLKRGLHANHDARRLKTEYAVYTAHLDPLTALYRELALHVVKLS